jgi:hypothetical protein
MESINLARFRDGGRAFRHECDARGITRAGLKRVGGFSGATITALRNGREVSAATVARVEAVFQQFPMLAVASLLDDEA